MDSSNRTVVAVIAIMALLAVTAPVAAAFATAECEVCCCATLPEDSSADDTSLSGGCPCELERPADLAPRSPVFPAPQGDVGTAAMIGPVDVEIRILRPSAYSGVIPAQSPVHPPSRLVHCVLTL